MKKIIIISITSDIGLSISNYFLKKKYFIFGSYRNKKLLNNIEKNKKLTCFKLDLTNNQSIKKFCIKIKKKFNDWDYIIFCNGDLDPIGKFKDINFDKWETSLNINYLSSLKILNLLLKKNRSNKNRGVLFFAGGGTNNAVSYYSAYTLSKILLIKFVELFDFEEKKISTCILGPGWINTKIHKSTLKSKIKNFKNKKITEKIVMRNDDHKLIKLNHCINWILKNIKKISGRNLSLDYDNWGSKKLLDKLKKNKNLYKLRRFGN